MKNGVTLIDSFYHHGASSKWHAEVINTRCFGQLKETFVRVKKTDTNPFFVWHPTSGACEPFQLVVLPMKL